MKACCPGCGHPQDETTALDDRRQPVHEYTAHSTVCQACEAVDEEKRRIRTRGEEDDMDGRKFYVTREDDA